MSTFYCTDCPAKIEYEATKPAKCPKCGVVFANAFKGVVAAPTPAARASAPIIDDDDPPPVPRHTTVAKPRYRHGEVIPPVGRMTPVGQSPEPVVDGIGDEGDDGDEDEIIDPRAKRRLARELAATLNPDDIFISDDDEKPLRFEQIWNDPEAAKQRESGGGGKRKKGRR